MVCVGDRCFPTLTLPPESPLPAVAYRMLWQILRGKGDERDWRRGRGGEGGGRRGVMERYVHGNDRHRTRKLPGNQMSTCTCK